ncbi:MAG: hypothetical protein UY48_C0008G0049 [Candidatus Gottesmanbacteria bacterium GW2011_GWB1_49_7]|uniref:CMP/dCMP-type deaminase domain-containing protein n=1 Tax=Candidatus Gottesmanbacteria bacterium GW2011_GWB1_49_7 TaxID=1618448 RepID=A0A0G1Z293_9BACT|nr:MAG: hypothetical protein UY48_C0008G0049 [Candidatus Gottesmanbacteria bacterium GW2011_GWB1_49_7]
MISHEILERMRRRASKTNATYRIVALATIDGKIVCCTPTARFFNYGGGVHSEQWAMVKMPKARHIILARFNASGQLLPISPCARCAKHAQRRGIKITVL